MKFKGIIPELKFSEGSNQVDYFIEKFEEYPVVAVNTSSVFNGNISFMAVVRAKYPKKFIIRKDFIMIPKQIEESKEMGADAVLLIADFLTTEQYVKLTAFCKAIDIEYITEIGNVNFGIIGRNVLINSRNLNTGKFHRELAEEHCRFWKERSKSFNVIYASGEKSDRVIKKGIADAVLIGTAFMQEKMKNE